MSKSSSPGLTPFGQNEPAEVTIVVTVPAETKRAAAQIAREYASRKLETVLGAFVGDMAVAMERPGSWEAERVTGWLRSHVWLVEPLDEVPRLRDDEVMGCIYGHYPWDGWQRWAFTHGVPIDLATLGRAVIREAWQHGWDEELRAECGWRDDGRGMLALALTDPKRAEARWSELLDTDGGRVDPQTGEVL